MFDERRADNPVSSSGVSIREVARGFRWGSRPLAPASAQPWVPDEDAGREFPTAWSRSPIACAVRAAGQAAVLRPLVHAEVAPTVSGLDALAAASEPCLLVANHSSHLDTALLLSVLPAGRRSRLLVAAAADYFFESWWRAVGSALAFGTLPLDRTSGSSAVTPLDVLADGWSLLIFPEGTRSVDGRQAGFKTGVARLAAAAGVPVVPIGLRGAYNAMPRGRRWPLPGRPPVAVRFGYPMRPAGDETPRAFADRLAAEVQRLVTEDETTWWASLREPRAEAEQQAPREAARWRRTWSATAPVQAPRSRDPWA